MNYVAGMILVIDSVQTANCAEAGIEVVAILKHSLWNSTINRHWLFGFRFVPCQNITAQGMCRLMQIDVAEV